jgi:hypothetical protein
MSKEELFVELKIQHSGLVVQHHAVAAYNKALEDALKEVQYWRDAYEIAGDIEQLKIKE